MPLQRLQIVRMDHLVEILDGRPEGPRILAENLVHDRRPVDRSVIAGDLPIAEAGDLLRLAQQAALLLKNALGVFPLGNVPQHADEVRFLADPDLRHRDFQRED